MSVVVVAAAAASIASSSSSLSKPSLQPTPSPYLNQTLTDQNQTAFPWLSQWEWRRDSSIGEIRESGGGNGARRVLEISSKTTGAPKRIEVEVDKPLGLTLGKKPGGGVVVTAVAGGGNAAKAGLKAGDQVLYTSSFFGDELWPADKLGFVRTTIQANPDSVYLVLSRGDEVDVKRLLKKTAPSQFDRKLTDAQKARATHICIDCGFIDTLPKPFDEQPDTYAYPQCSAPKKRFARYDVTTGKAIRSGLPTIRVIIGLVAGIAGIGACFSTASNNFSEL